MGVVRDLFLMGFGAVGSAGESVLSVISSIGTAKVAYVLLEQNSGGGSGP